MVDAPGGSVVTGTRQTCDGRSGSHRCDRRLAATWNADSWQVGGPRPATPVWSGRVAKVRVESSGKMYQD